MKRLAGKTALVTGASRGIGRAIAQRLAAEGAPVGGGARGVHASAGNPGTLDETVALIEANGGRAIPLACDLENQAECERLIERASAAAGPIDILVNNAGLAEYVPLADMPIDLFDRTMTHYLRAPFILIQKAVPQMKARGAGWIVNIGSVTAQPPIKPYNVFDTQVGSTIYATAKAAMNRFTQGAAAELLADNIAVNLVAPSTAIVTPGAARYIPEDYPGENVAYLAHTVVEMCLLPAAERTGLVTHSMHYPAAHKLDVVDLDGVTPLPPAEIPAWSHPAVNASGE